MNALVKAIKLAAGVLEKGGRRAAPVARVRKVVREAGRGEARGRARLTCDSKVSASDR